MVQTMTQLPEHPWGWPSYRSGQGWLTWGQRKHRFQYIDGLGVGYFICFPLCFEVLKRLEAQN